VNVVEVLSIHVKMQTFKPVKAILRRGVEEEGE
jgi:hypothetical protein